jgi:hypothetical protein
MERSEIGDARASIRCPGLRYASSGFGVHRQVSKNPPSTVTTLPVM